MGKVINFEEHYNRIKNKSYKSDTLFVCRVGKLENRIDFDYKRIRVTTEFNHEEYKVLQELSPKEVTEYLNQNEVPDFFYEAQVRYFRFPGTKDVLPYLSHDHVYATHSNITVQVAYDPIPVKINSNAPKYISEDDIVEIETMANSVMEEDNNMDR